MSNPLVLSKVSGFSLVSQHREVPGVQTIRIHHSHHFWDAFDVAGTVPECLTDVISSSPYNSVR